MACTHKTSLKGRRTSLKSWNFLPGRCRNSPHSFSLMLAPLVFAAASAARDEGQAVQRAIVDRYRTIRGTVGGSGGRAINELQDLMRAVALASVCDDARSVNARVAVV